MNIFKLSPTRAIAHYGNYSNEMFKGSTINRKNNEYRNQQVRQRRIFAFNEDFEEATPTSREETNSNGGSQADNILWNDPVNKPTIAKCRIPYWRHMPNDIYSEKRRTASRLHSLSTRSKYKIRDKIESLYAASGGKKFTFLTLTFISKVTDQNAQKILNKFLTVARQNFGKFIYIWVAERQENGNVHFHLIADKYFKISKFNALWIMQQYKAGIQHPDYSESEVKQHYVKGSLQKILNPVDVKSINSVTGLSIYLTMYVTQNNDTFNCRVWHCCRKVSALFTAELVDQKTFEKARQPEFNFSVNIKTGELYEARTFISPHAMIVQIYNKKYFGKKLSSLNALNKWIIDYSYKVDNIDAVKDYFKVIPEVNCLDFENWYGGEKKSRFVVRDIERNLKKENLKNLFDKPYKLN